MKTLHIILVLIILCLSGCASTTHLTTKLSSIQSDEYIFIESNIFYEESRGVGVLWKEGLKKGKYRPELTNEHGTFYKGPEGCVEQFMENAPMGVFDGGVWIPKDKVNNAPRIYYYFEYNRSKGQPIGGVISTVILESGKGDITFMPPIKDAKFLEQTKVINI